MTITVVDLLSARLPPSMSRPTFPTVRLVRSVFTVSEMSGRFTAMKAALVAPLRYFKLVSRSYSNGPVILSTSVSSNLCLGVAGGLHFSMLLQMSGIRFQLNLPQVQIEQNGSFQDFHFRRALRSP